MTRTSIRNFLAVGLAALSAMLVGSANGRPPSTTGVRFTDVTRQAGIQFIHNTGAFGKKFLPETMGAGCAFLDYDNDGWPDILLVNGMDFPGHKRKRTTPKLYRNIRASDGSRVFTDVTAQAGLNIEIYGMGVAVGDYDNDGFDDIYLTGLHQARLFHNERNGTFRDVTAAAGVNNRAYGASAVWFDYDRDGKLDLFVTNYVHWTEKEDIYCTLDGVHKSYCTPEAYKGETCRLYHNLGNGHFEDVTQKVGLYDPTSKALGVVVLDYDMDGWPDLLVANDTQPNKLYHNIRAADGRRSFNERGVQAGIAFSEDGIARGAMGTDAADYDGSGFPSVLIGNFSNQMLGLYHNEGNRLFIDEAPSSTVGRASLLSLTFGLFFFDANLDGLQDMFVANGHIETEIGRLQPQVSYAQLPLLFENRGRKQFVEIGQAAGFRRKFVARGAAYADYDNDGDLDILVTTNAGPAYLYRNDSAVGNHSLRLKTVGVRSNKDGIGALVRARTREGLNWQTVHSGSSYCSQSELTLTFGLGKATQADTVEILWPSGQHDSLKNLKADFTYALEEGRGVVGSRAFGK